MEVYKRQLDNLIDLLGLLSPTSHFIEYSDSYARVMLDMCTEMCRFLCKIFVVFGIILTKTGIADNIKTKPFIGSQSISYNPM